MTEKLEILPITLLEAYLRQVPTGLPDAFEQLHDADISTDAFSFYTSVASVYSSKIEGEDIELDSYVKHKRFGIEFQPDYTKKIDDLYSAYSFAKDNPLTAKNLESAHQLLSKNLLASHQQGKFRTQNMYVSTPAGRIEYVAASPFAVNGEMEKLHADITHLLAAELSFEEVFFFTSMIHLVFVKTHPFNDGNGRTARLLEKWFIAQKLGQKAWFLASERHYYEHHQTYYDNLCALGLEYETLDFGKALPFLWMLPNAIIRLSEKVKREI